MYIVFRYKCVYDHWCQSQNKLFKSKTYWRLTSLDIREKKYNSVGEDLIITIWYSIIKNKQICSGGNIWVNWNFVRNLCDMCACYNLCMHALWSSECEALLELIWDEEKLYLVLFFKKKTYTYANLTLFSIL